MRQGCSSGIGSTYVVGEFTCNAGPSEDYVGFNELVDTLCSRLCT